MGSVDGDSCICLLHRQMLKPSLSIPELYPRHDSRFYFWVLLCAKHWPAYIKPADQWLALMPEVEELDSILVGPLQRGMFWNPTTWNTAQPCSGSYNRLLVGLLPSLQDFWVALQGSQLSTTCVQLLVLRTRFTPLLWASLWCTKHPSQVVPNQSGVSSLYFLLKLYLLFLDSLFLKKD